MNVETLIERKQSQHFDTAFKLVNDSPRFKKVFAFLEKYPKRGKLLDIGCSTGDFAAILKKIGFESYGLELDKKGVIEAKKKGVFAKQGSFLTSLPYENNLFDFIFAGEVIEHTVDDDRFLYECFRILKRGGMLILTTPNLVSLGNRFLMALGFLPRFAYQEFHYRIYNEKLLKRKLINAGFTINKITAGHVGISMCYNKLIGFFGEKFADFYPRFGEQFIVYATKSK